MPRSYCVDCERTYTNLSTHFRKSRRHQKNNNRNEPVECTICNEERERDQFVKCDRCVHTWCRTCQTAVDDCPYCRYRTPYQRYALRRRERERRRQDLERLERLGWLMFSNLMLDLLFELQ